MADGAVKQVVRNNIDSSTIYFEHTIVYPTINICVARNIMDINFGRLVPNGHHTVSY